VHVTRGYHALALDFSFEVEDAELAEYLEWLFEGFEEPVTSERYQIGPDPDDPDRIVLRCQGAVEASGSNIAQFGESIVQWINRRSVEPDYGVAAHAGGVERGGVACLLPADPESGKTTLTTGLVRAGYSYLTDEAVSFDWKTGEIEPFPKPLSIDPGSQHLFPELRPPARAVDEATQWQVPPRSIRRDAIGNRCRAGFVIFPKYTPDVPTRLESISRGEALVELAKNTFRFREHSRPALDLLSGVVRGAQCYRLTVSTLDDGVDAVARLLEGAR
jgi:hypothetical protein